jgi:PAS domain S-box-containing protein/putative nucleotidyltransferase with HDIG domain
MTDTIWLMDMNLSITYSSPSVAKRRGYTDEEIKQLPLEKQVTPESLNNAMAVFAEEMEKLEADPSHLLERTLELELCRKDGTTFWSETTFSLIRDENGTPVSILCEGRDIADRKRAEDALRKSEEKYRSIIENMQEGYFENDLAGNFTFANDALCKSLGYPREELIGKNNRQYTDEETAKEIYQIYSRIYRTGEQCKGIEEEFIRKDGIKGFAELSVSLISDAEGKPIGFRGISHDITERKLAEEALAVSEAQYRLLADNIKDQVWLMDLNLKPTYISPSVERSRGYTFEEIAQLPLDKQLTATSLKSAMEFFSIEMPKALADPTYYMTRLLELEFCCKDGSTLWLENTFTLIRDENGKPLSLLGAGRDITERKQAEQALRESEERFRSLFENSLMGISAATPDGHLIHANLAYARMYGYDNPVEMMAEINDIGHKLYANPEERKEVLRILTEKGIMEPREMEVVRRDGTRFFSLVSAREIRDAAGKLLYYQATHLDITERKQSFERMRKALGATVQAISITVEMKDPYTSGHQRRVSDLARAMATEMGLSADQRDFIRTASAIHDIGKIAIPTEILSKPTKLTDLEFNLIKTHAQSGYDILKDIKFPWPVADVVLQHHERMDGSGYPRGLKRDDILLEARILAIADVVEAIASHRPYRPALGVDLALEEISRNKGILYDADAVDACLKLFREKGYTLVLKKS